MPTDKRVGSKVPTYTDRDKVIGAKRDTSTLIGVVKNNADPARAGRLQVYIPTFGGDERESSHWITVSYANPYMGAARTPAVVSPRSPDNEFTKVNHSYGMWFTPPDIGNQVLVTFIDGDINHGYWFACIMPDLGHWAIPGQAGANNLETPLDATLASALTTPPYPAVEFNEENETLQSQYRNFLTINKPIHDDQVKTLLAQGLEDDKVRGVITSSSQRESPSKVFGVSTPGADGPVKDKTTGQITYRKGGHTFVMDDGNKDGIDQLIRLRSAGGHQILMNDNEDIMYIGNKTGTVWLEFTGEGKTNLYSESDINIRTKTNINFHADNDINMYAGNSIKTYAGSLIKQQSATININATSDLQMWGGKVGLGSGSTLAASASSNLTVNAGANFNMSAGSNLTAKAGSALNLDAAADGTFLAGGNLVYQGSLILLNSSPAPSAPQAPSVLEPTAIPVVMHKETVSTMSAPYFKWKAAGQTSSTIPTSAPIPTHEPYILHPSGPAKGKISKTPGSSPSITPTATVTATTTPAITTTTQVNQPGPLGAASKGLAGRQLSVSGLVNQPKNLDGIGSLTPEQTTALKAQMAKSESNFNYTAINSIGFVGKYQFGYLALIDRGYVTRNTTSNNQLTNPLHWTGQDGINSLDAFLNSPEVQERTMDEHLGANHSALIRLGTINDTSPPEDIAGKLAVCHLLGAGGCNSWTNGSGGVDQYGTTGDTYYNLGHYAVSVLSTNIA